MHVVIIGNGVSGVSAAFRIRARRPDWQITMISGESRHHFARPALMYIFMGHMRYADTKPYPDAIWEEQRIDLVRDWVSEIDVEASRLILQHGRAIPYDRLLLATGSRSNKFGWTGQDLEGVQGLWGLPDLHQLYENVRHSRRAVIVGGGLIGIELAEMLNSRGVHVTFLVREQSYWNNIMPAEESAMINREIARHGMDLILGTNLAAILDDGRGRACGVRTEFDDTIDCELVGLTAGVSPNTELVRDTPIECGRGVLVDSSLQTSVPEIYAAGDCAEIIQPEGQRNLIQQVWYTGKQQGAVAGDVIAGQAATYQPATWYNSAKFLDLEHQVYGRINMRVAGEKNLYWEHPDGKHSLRLAYTEDGLIGVALMGIRYRHQLCRRWIEEGWAIDDVLDRLGEANFDPEFYRRHEADMIGTLRTQMR